MSMEGNPTPQVVEPFDEAAWRARLDVMAKNANSGCGLSHDLYQSRVSGSVDYALEKMPEDHRARAREIAVEHVDYATPEQLDESARRNAEDGCCSHGIDRDCCPAGCGDLYDDDDWVSNQPDDWEAQMWADLGAERWWPHCRGIPRGEQRIATLDFTK